MGTTRAQRETLAYGLELEAAMLEVGMAIEVAYAKQASVTTVESVASFLPRFHVEAKAITLISMARASAFTAEHVNRLLGQDVEIPEAEANQAAEATDQMLAALRDRYMAGVEVDAIRQQLLGRGEEAYAQHLLNDIQGKLPDHALSLYEPARNAYVQEARNGVNVQTSVVKYTMLAAADG
ncbi:MAG: hypothetical protein ACYTFZ_04000 [Planctomycetota bacterium]|jgi:hypothetical protein